MTSYSRGVFEIDISPQTECNRGIREVPCALHLTCGCVRWRGGGVLRRISRRVVVWDAVAIMEVLWEEDGGRDGR